MDDADGLVFKAANNPVTKASASTLDDTNGYVRDVLLSYYDGGAVTKALAETALAKAFVDV